MEEGEGGGEREVLDAAENFLASLPLFNAPPPVPAAAPSRIPAFTRFFCTGSHVPRETLQQEPPPTPNFQRAEHLGKGGGEGGEGKKRSKKEIQAHYLNT